MKAIILAGLVAIGSWGCLALADVKEPKVGESFQIESVAHEGQLLRVEDAKSADGTPMVLYPKQAWKCMTWELQAGGEGVRLKNHFTKKTLGPSKPEINTEALPVIQKKLEKTPAAEEAWKFVPIEGKAGLFKIVHAKTGLALEATDEGRVYAKQPSDSAAQQWRLLPKPEPFTG